MLESPFMGCTDLYIIGIGALIGHRYEYKILRPIGVPYAAAIVVDTMLMDDNCKLHHAKLVHNFLFEEGITRMKWSACSPGMNPTEHVCDILDQGCPTQMTLRAASEKHYNLAGRT
ncbi:transposable element Tcb2 transposase [Trichonephila clavipes]|nr:transposable element Tcb2 transposase [Trichonephila clavipes]